MICTHCREGARLARPEVILTDHAGFSSSVTGMTVSYPYSARQSHERCREFKRQASASLNATERSGGSWCDCAHVLPVPGKR